MKLNKLYVIEFHDHCLSDNTKENIVCKVAGWLHSKRGNYYTLCYWKTKSTVKCPVTEKSNREYVKILKKAVISCRLISQ